ncbi:MAG: FAD-binding oxidoreductase, partial [Synechocystis sp.]
GVFKVMAAQGDEVLRPFLQDVIQFGGLTSTLPRVNPLLVLPLLPPVGLPALLDWLRHYSALAAYRAIYPLANQLFSETQSFQQKRWLDAWRYGAGLDWHGS